MIRKFEFRPWGWYITLDQGVDYKVKKIYVKPSQRFSLQYHNHREEHWTIVEGVGKITQGDLTTSIETGKYVYIPKGVIHRLEGGDKGITFIEVQRGKCYEEDIIRLEDDYGRT
tara:strand:+ start:1179 stop:1520 length:342 start_codon:yes stop_codon:yes gene_type:complete